MKVSSTTLEKYIKLSGGNAKFTSYQSKIIDYFNKSYEETLLLLYMEVGTGKTLTSLACAIEGLKNKKFKKIVILSPKSIQDEFEKNLKLYFKISPGDEDSVSDAIHMIAYNSIKAYRNFKQLGSLNKTLFIVDEVHLFLKSIIKTNLLPSQMNMKTDIGNAIKIFNAITSTDKKKLICLTGTPSAKHPFELVPLFNAAGCSFPSNVDQFTLKYIDSERHIMNHRQDIMKQLQGKIIYVKSNASSQKLKVTDLVEVDVEMSRPQYNQYCIDYKKELEEESYTNKRNIYGIIFGAKSSFHAKTFEDCIYWNNELTNKKDDKDRYRSSRNTLIIDKAHCPKIIKMYDDSTKYKGSCVFYFRFVRMYGIETMESKLIAEGYVLAETNDDIWNSKEKRYVLFTGNISFSTRNKWKDLFNDPRNKHGEYIKYLLISPSGAVGVSLKNVRYLGIGSVEFNYSAIRQIQGRVNRLNSHIDLPENERRLDNFIYITSKNKSYYKQHKETLEQILTREAPEWNEVAPTIERIIYQDSIMDDKINEDFRNILQEISVL